MRMLLRQLNNILASTMYFCNIYFVHSDAPPGVNEPPDWCNPGLCITLKCALTKKKIEKHCCKTIKSALQAG